MLEIDLAAIADNWRTLRARHAGRPTAAVLKADAYGTGAARVAPHLYAAGCRHFFTAHLDEALALRPLLPGALVAPLNGVVPGSEADYLASGIDPVLSSADEVRRWAALARRTGRRLPALLHIDTGLARRGVEQHEIPGLTSEGAFKTIALRYVLTHLVAADEPDDPANIAQLRAFNAACVALPPAPRSLANSAGLWLGVAFHSDLARPGAALYGINPTQERDNPMRPVVRLRARVLQVREVASGNGVGYNATWRAQRPTRIATVGVGYADGWPRALSNRGAACFAGTSVPLVGRVSMDLSTYDVTDLPALGPGDWLDLLGPGCAVADVAARAGTSPYEILTSLGRRYARIFRA